MLNIVFFKYPNQEKKLQFFVSNITKKEEEGNITKNHEYPTKIFYFGVIGFIILNFVSRGLLSVLETNSSPIFMSVWEPNEIDTPGFFNYIFSFLKCYFRRNC